MEAQYKDETVEHILGMSVITTKRGQSIKSLETWSKRWKWSRDKTRRFLKMLEGCGMIAYENATKTVRITVCNYDYYQDPCNANATEVVRNQNALKTQVHTDNKGKEGKQDKKKASRIPTLEEDREYLTEKGSTIDPDQFWNHYEANGWMRGKTRIQKWKSCVVTWEKGNKQQPNQPDLLTMTASPRPEGN